uniref:hypothetical protein n=1 Tax=Escherichia coli TaxID=562 RepID=UPI00402A0A07
MFQGAISILTTGRHLNRKNLCTKLLVRLEQATSQEEEQHYQALIGMLFERQI